MAGHTGSLGDLRFSLLPLLLVVTFIFFVNVSHADEIFLTVDVKKPLALTSDKFLSYTLDPSVILTGDALARNPERSINMARALSPAFVRIGGPRSNSYTFVRSQRMHYDEDPNFTITESNWIDVNRWAENAGLDILVCITPQHTEIGGGDSVWDSRNALELISFSDHMGFNTSWQLGYECQTRCDVTGIDSGRAVMRLRRMLDAFPRYSKSLITGPDVVAYRTKQQQQYLQNYLTVAGKALSAITWHPNFAGVTFDDEGVFMQHDSLAIDRDNLYRSIGRSIWKKPLWIAESKSEDCKKQYLGAVVWTRRLGNAARLGVQVVMRQPHGSNLLQPTPDYWVSVLHKALVGREVFDARITNSNRSHVHFYCQCTKPSSKYEKGSLTVFGINLSPKKVVVNLKSLKVKTIHKYILLPGFDAHNRMFSETILLNNVTLELVNERELPKIRPIVSSTSKGVSLKLPSGGIGFWVLPGLKIRSCGDSEDDNTDKTLLKRSLKRLRESEFDEEHVAGEGGKYIENFWMESNKNRKRSNPHYNGANDNKRHDIKIEVKKDLENLEKLLRKHESSDDQMSPWKGRTSYFGFDDSSLEQRLNGNIFEDETSGELREKLKEYKRRMKQYEYKIKTVEPLSRAHAMDSEETVDSEKVIDAMRLISKMDDAVRKLEMSGKTNKAILEKYGISNGKNNPNNNRSPDDTFLDKLLNSRKIKRTSVPSRIEDQLRAIYQMLADEKERRQRNNSATEQIIGTEVGVINSTTARANLSRSRREADERFGVGLFGLRKEGMNRRSSPFTDGTRGRRNQWKDNRRDRHAFIIDSQDTSDSEEDDFYDFHERDLVKNSPTGDVRFSIGNSEEDTSSDHDCEIDDDEERHVKKTSKSWRRHKTCKPREDKHLWVEMENPQGRHVPIDYFENVRMSNGPRVHKTVKGHRELWEDDSISERNEDTSSAETDRLARDREIIPQRYLDAWRDRRTEESRVGKLIDYYEGPSAQSYEIPEYESAEELEPRIIHTRIPVQPITSHGASSLKVGFDAHHQTPLMKRNPVESEKRCENESCSDGSESSTDVKSVEFDKSTGSLEEKETPSSGDTTYKITDEPAKRKKRSINDLLEDVLDREMIHQDDNNLKDCDCRVPRSTAAAVKDSNVKKGKRLNFPWKKTSSSAQRGLRKPGTLRKNRKREETSVSKPITSQQENDSRATRRKRSLELLDKKMTHVTTEIPASISERGKSTNYADLPANPETRRGKIIENLSLDNEMINSMTETRATRHVVKRGDKPRWSSKIVQTQQKHSETEESSTSKIEPIEGKGTFAATIASNTTFFRVRKNRKENVKMLDGAPEGTSYPDNTTVPIAGTVRTPFYKSNKIVYSDKNVTATTDAPSSTTVPEKDFEETTKEIQEPDVVITTSTKTKKRLKKLELAVSKLRRKLATTSTTTSTIPATIGYFPELTTPMPPIIAPESQKKQQTTTLAPIVPLTRNNDKKNLLKSKKLQKIIETSTATSPVVASIENNEETGSAELKNSEIFENNLQTTSSPVLATIENNNEKKSLKPRRTELLQKLRERFRQRREKLVDTYREELLSELDAASEENRHIYRREIMNMMMNEPELLDLADRAKLEYPSHNKPRDSEAMVKPYSVNDTEVIERKYVPEILEVLRPLYVAREPIVEPRTQNVETTITPESLMPQAEALKTENINLRLNDDTTNNKIARRADKPYYGDIESLESLPVHQKLTYGEEFRDKTTIAMIESTELDEAMENPSTPQNDKKIVLNHVKDNRSVFSKELGNVDYDLVPNPNNEVKISSSILSGELDNPMLNARNHTHVLLEENLEKNSSEGTAKLLELMEEKTPYHTESEINQNTGIEAPHLSKKRNLQNSDFDADSKYDSPKYARLSIEKSEFPQVDKVRGTNVNNLESEETLKKVGSKILNKKRVEPGDKSKSWIVKRLMDNFQENHSAMIDFADLDEALNSGNYELVMLVPVNNDQKKHRRKRHVETQIARDPDYSVTNEITIDMTPEKFNELLMKEDAAIVYDNHNIRMNEIAPNFPHSTDFINDKEKTDHSTTGYLIPGVIKRQKTLNDNEIKILLGNGLSKEETFQSVPEIVVVHGEKSLSNRERPDLLEEAKLEATVADNLDKVQRISGSFEKFINDFGDRFNQKESKFETKSDTPKRNAENDLPTSSDIFGTTFVTMKKLFHFLSGLVELFGVN